MTHDPTHSPFALTGTHTVVTGGSRGLGRGIAHGIAAAGGAVTIVARSAEQAAATAAEIAANGGTAQVRAADIGALDELDSLIADIAAGDPIDGIVHAAGIQLRKPAMEVSPAELLRVLNVNLHAPYLLSAAVARHQTAAERAGSHVFIGSLNSSIGLPGISPYVVAKTGLVGMARAFSTEWSAAGIRANVVAPGYFATEMTEGLLANPADHDRIMARIPMRQLGDPADIGNACVYLLSPAARYVSGTLLNVDGGWLAS
ncbi:SDR family NAD(P)-dependent oxidoreductase [Leucobacter luti]|uniref:2-deoxy-D-gluconate 3-dehydrogenase n=1 Tax=Leucobacter luti TaxID=340320 RepID=A0A4Q7U0L1_9MICO|nr:SDR family oxidoreductase [Leucobacter luti]MBL3699365.1 SDR family oxidoreductase [Leucobacter luti]RZT66875.1 2-deoxy-D-gluconate 3-dehydrogenase [Leucobacter luti]